MRLSRAPRLLAATVLTAAASGAAIVAAPPAVAAGNVAIVISNGSSVVAKCLPWTGASGDALLNQATNGQVHYQRAGGIDQINGFPSPPGFADDYYWAYFHNSGGGWAYSTVGASGSHPAAGTVEGWQFDNHSSVKPAPTPPALSFASICGAPPAPVTSAAAAPPPAPAASTTNRTPGATTSPPRSVATTTAVTPSTPDATAPAASSVSSVNPGDSPGPSPTGASSARPSIESSPVSTAAAARATSGGSAVPVLIGVGLVVVLAVGAFVAARYRRAS